MSWRLFDRSTMMAFAVVTGLSLVPHGSCAFHSVVKLNCAAVGQLFLSDYYSEDEEESSIPCSKRKRIRPSQLRRACIDDREKIRRIDAQERREQTLQDPSLLTSMRFADHDDMHPATKRAIVEVLGLQEMTQIQAQTYSVARQGKNVVGRARTGTGKTLAYLMPTLERLFQGDKSLYIPGRSIGILILAPTRELAQQISDQAASLLTFHSSELSVACIYGGTKMHRDITLLSNPSRLPTILVATPGRLLEHLSETKIQGRQFRDVLDATKIVVLDEMDCLLDMGFKKDALKILSYLPRKRQTLLFSATLPKSMRGLITDLLGKDFHEINCVDEDDVASLTNSRVEQFYVQLESMDDYVRSLVRIINHEIGRNKNYKIVVFLPTTKLVSFFADFLKTGLGMDEVMQLHSRMSQSARQRTSNQFRLTQSPSILITTDVSSRGVDYPNISLVLQHGSPDNELTYIHRLGRTGRAGRNGVGVQLVLPFEKHFLAKLQKRGVVEDSDLLRSDLKSNSLLEKAFLALRSGHSLLTPAAQGAYRSFLAYYIERASDLGLEPIDVVNAAASFSLSTGLSEVPGLEKKTAVSLGIENLVKIECSR